VAVVNVNLYAFEWYRRTLAETHPNLLPSVDGAPPVEALITRWLSERPVYVAEDIGLPLRLAARTLADSISRVTGVTD
jgi:hypothetical protein